MVGKKLGHYEILEPLGAGGMGEVFRARDTRLDRDVAIKMLPEDLARDPQRLARFEREAKLLASLQHASIAAIYGLENEDDRRAIVMELIDGESLGERIARAPVPIDEAIDIARQIAAALEATHEKGIVHRDLKPGNVMLVPGGAVKVLDFGVAKAFPEPGDVRTSADTAAALTATGGAVGTGPYMSPEQIRGEAVDARADIWALGCVLYEALSGRRAFSAATLGGTLSAILECDVDWNALPRATPPEIRALLIRCLQKDPGQRPRSATELRRGLEPGARSSSSTAVGVAANARVLIPLLLVAAAIAIGMGTGFIPTGFGGARPAPPIGSTGRLALAVLDFASHTETADTAWLARGVPSMLLTDLAQTPGLDLVSGQRVHEIVEALGGRETRAHAGLLGEIAARTGAGVVVGGDIFVSDAGLRIDAQLEDVASARILGGYSVRGQEVYALVEELADRIRADLDMAQPEAGASLAEATTSSPVAYRLYTEGVDARRNLRLADARDAFAQALAVDPTFAMAYYELSVTALSMNDTLTGEANRCKAVEYSAKLPERHRLLVEAWCAQRPDGDLQRAAALLEELLSRYPDDEDAYDRLFHLYDRSLREAERALSTLTTGVREAPYSGVMRNHYGYALLDRRRFGEAIEQFEALINLYPEEPNSYDSLAEAFLASGRVTEAAEMYARAYGIDPGFGPPYFGRAWAVAALGDFDEALRELDRYGEAQRAAGDEATPENLMRGMVFARVGRLREAEEQIRPGVARGRAIESPLFVADHEIALALLALEAGDLPTTIARAETALQTALLIPDTRRVDRRGALLVAHLLAGVAAARNGDHDTAERHAAAQRAIYDAGEPAETWWYHSLLAEIALANDDLAAADDAIARGWPQGRMPLSLATPGLTLFSNNLSLRDAAARLAEKRGDLNGAIATYRELLSPTEGAWNAILEPRFVLALARLLDQAGDRREAMVEYRRFTQLWAGADASLSPLLDEARRRLEEAR